MSLSRDKFPIVFTIIENFGLSSSWTGNAVASANPTNFYSMWERYPHTVLYPEKTNKDISYENNEIDLARLSCGRYIDSDKNFVDEAFLNNQIAENKNFGSLLDETLARNSALHLIGNVPGPDNKYSDIEHLLSILRVIKNKKIFRVFLHLIVDDSLEESPEVIDQFLAKINQMGACEVASVVGQNFLSNENANLRTFTQGAEAIVNGSGNSSLSAEQAISLKGISHSGDKQPTSVRFKNRYVCKFGNFDTVLFFNHSNKHLSRLIMTVASAGGSPGRLKLPKFLRVASLLSPLEQEIPQLEIIFKRSINNSLAQVFAASGVDQLYMSDSSRIFAMNEYFKGAIADNQGGVKELFVPVGEDNSSKNYGAILDMFLRQLANHLEQKTARFIVILIPVLSQINCASFSETVSAIKLIDRFLPKLEELILKYNGALVLTSDHGGAEKLSDRDEIEQLNNKTGNPVPFILTVPGYSGEIKGKKDVVFNQILYDMIKKRHFINDAATTILELAQVEALPEMTGKSFLKDLKIKIG